MESASFMKVDEVAQELGISKSYVYKIVQKLNGELKSKGFITISGRINREYFNERLYEYHSLQYSARWGLLLPESCALAKKAVIEKTDISDIPLILHHRTGLQQKIAHWAQTEVERLHIASTYNIVKTVALLPLCKAGLGISLLRTTIFRSSLSMGFASARFTRL